MGAGILDCDVTFTPTRKLVVSPRHERFLHTSHHISGHRKTLASSTAVHPASGDTRASAEVPHLGHHACRIPHLNGKWMRRIPDCH